LAVQDKQTLSLRICSLVVGSLLAILPVADAAFSQTLPTGAAPERTLKRPQVPVPAIGPKAREPVEFPWIAPSPPSGLPRGKLMLRKIELSGVTVFDVAELEPLYTGMLNREVPYSELYGIANRITAKYHAAGYVLSQAFVPGQEVNTRDGIVHIWVVEGSLQSYRIIGDPGGSRSAIERYAKKLLQMRALRKADLERYLLLMNDLPGTAVVGYVNPGDRGLQNAELIISAANKSSGGIFGVDNRGSEFFGPEELYGTLQGNSLLGFGDLIEISPIITGDGGKLTSKGGFLNIRVPIFSDGAYVQAYFAGSSTSPGGYLDQYDLEGEAFIGTFALGYPLIRELGRYLYGAIQFDYMESKEDIYSDQPFVKDKLRVLRGQLAYGEADSWGGENFVDLRLSLGIDGLGASSDDDPLRSRTNAQASFVAFEFHAMRRQSLSAVADNLRLVLGVMGQYSPDSLLSGEEFGLGGPIYLRAYDFYDIAGDYGIAARFELQYGLPLKDKTIFNAMELFGFYDIGQIWNHDPLPFELSDGSLASTGAGFRLTVWNNIFASLYAAQPLTRDVTAAENKDLRYFFQLGVVW
jgi:hemolysin activation/secretion protein